MKKILFGVLFNLPILILAQSTLLQNVNIVDVINGDILPNKTLEIKDGLIHKIHDKTYGGNFEDQVRDLKERYVIPGLIDGHTHIEHSGEWEKGWTYNASREGMIELLNHALRGGITTIREMACDVRVMGELSRAVQMNLFPSPDIYYPSLFAGPAFFKDPRAVAGARGETPGFTSWFRGIDENADLPNFVAQAKGNGSHAIKLYALLSADQIKAISKEAHSQGLKVYAHAFTQLAKPSEVIESGVNDVSHAPLLMYELEKDADKSTYPEDDHVLQDLYSKMKANNVSMDPTIFVFRSNPKSEKRALLAAKITEEAHKAGVLISAGTDSISSYRTMDLPFIHDEILYYARDCNFSNLEALKTATINTAIVLGIENEIGSIEVRKKANLVILNANPLEDISNTRKIHFVMKNGIIYER